MSVAQQERNGRLERTLRRVAVAGVALLALATVWSCGEPPEAADTRPSVVLIVVDTLRADHLSLYGYPRATSPNLDRFAAGALVYDRAFTVTNHTLPAHVSLLTGAHPAAHGVHSNGWKFDGRYRTLAQRLGEIGYETAAFVSGFPLTADSGLDAGFKAYAEAKVRGQKVGKIHGRLTNTRALRWLETHHESPFFLLVHYYDTHPQFATEPGVEPPFVVDEVLEARLEEIGASDLTVEEVSSAVLRLDNEPLSLPEAVNVYDNRIHRVDQLIADVFAALRRHGVWDDSLIIVTSDHGEGLGQHRYYTHDLYLYEEQLRIPLIVRPPAGQRFRPGRIGAAVSLLDVYPTVLASVGLEAGAELPGRRLPWRASAGGLPPRWIVAQRRHFHDGDHQRLEPRFAADTSLYALRGDGPLKYLRTGRGDEELYDLSADPGELRNLASERPEDCARLAAELSRWLAEQAAGEPGEAPEIDPESRRLLESLGYL